MNKKEVEITKVMFKAKLQTIVKIDTSSDFNHCQMTIKAEFIIIVKNNPIEKLVFINITDNAKK